MRSFRGPIPERLLLVALEKAVPKQTWNSVHVRIGCSVDGTTIVRSVGGCPRRDHRAMSASSCGSDVGSGSSARIRPAEATRRPRPPSLGARHVSAGRGPSRDMFAEPRSSVVLTPRRPRHGRRRAVRRARRSPRRFEDLLRVLVMVGVGDADQSPAVPISTASTEPTSSDTRPGVDADLRWTRRHVPRIQSG